ncbi:hypothetical protein CLV24_13625 [Pontibacter ummariensis]|uniref:Uncharacterized protein n=1 Tax=Pontibacter ummariensis TaxID=1610492 RepID=A0A239L5A9_9BACT|nr:hypothetical protein CLV24_13625 [Pontibacter ummariensis]SNT25807.1 hypothetical protein SAMN06296052_13625 [Pontibacter ummariensis]
MLAYVAVQKKLLILIDTLWKKDEAWEEGKYPVPQPDPKEDIPHLSARSSLSGKGKIRKVQLKSLTFKTVPLFT